MTATGPTSAPAVPGIQLSTPLKSYSATDPGGWRHVIGQAEALDRAGVDRLAVPDHVVFGENLDAYGRPEIGGQAGGMQPTGPDGHWLEPMTLLSLLAGRTSRIRLATNILIAALRRPVVLAKTAATLDVLSGGRLDLGVGVGWQREEYDAAGLQFERRGDALDDTLAVCRGLWSQPRASFSSARLTFERIHMMPKPIQPGGVAIWVSGTVNPRVVRRLALFGVGWIPWGAAAADLRTGIAQMRQALDRAGRDPTGLQVVGFLPAVTRADGALDVTRTIAGVPALTAAGVTDVRLRLPVLDDAVENFEQACAVVAAFRAAVGRDRQVTAGRD
ncbi:MAG TPA: TIGR03619 family F420-dependent LLM class oxidoreductase [Pseudonocardiaceae bacterium]|jgi:probable F420-dependent oxidoreductase